MEYDVLIAGAGPAGLSAALTAAKSGARVAVFEKSKEIGYPIHTSGGSWLDELRGLEVPERFMHPVTEGQFISPNHKAVFHYQNPVSCILDVRGLYQYLAEIAAVAGAQVVVHSTVLGPEYDRNGKVKGLRVRRGGKESIFNAPLLIDASGASAVLARKAGLSQGFQRVGIGAELDLIAPKWPQNRVAFVLGREVAPSGYAWVFPHGNNRVRLGVGIITPDTKDDPKKYLHELMESSLFEESLSEASQIEYHSGVIPSEHYLSRTVADGLLVVGDAGGLVSTLLGEGIRFAIDIGRMAGEVAGEAVRVGRYDTQFLKKFEKRWQKKYAGVFRVGAFVNRRLACYSDADWDRRVQELSKMHPDLVPILLKGEFGPKNLLKIVRKTPTFFTRTVRNQFAKILDFRFRN